MLLAEYKRDVHQNYLVVREGTTLDTGSYQVKMLLANVVPGLLHCHLQNVDGEALLHYEVTSRQPLSRVQEGRQLGYEDLILVFEGFIKVMEAMGEYLLTPSMLVIDPEYIYTDAGQRELSFLYVPGYEVEVRDQFQSLTEYVLPRLDHTDARAVMLGYAVYRRALEDTFHLEHVKEELYRYREEPQEAREKAPPAPDPSPALGAAGEDLFAVPPPPPSWSREGVDTSISLKSLALVCGAVVLIVLLIAAKLLGFLPQISLENLLAISALFLSVCLLIRFLIFGRQKKKEEPQKAPEEPRMPRAPKESPAPPPAPARQGPRIVQAPLDFSSWEEQAPKREAIPESGGGEETIVLSVAGRSLPPTLVSREREDLPAIRLENELTIIGKMPGAADAILPLPTVSRVHARIRRKEGEYYLCDLNSRNGTSVNGQLLAADQEWQLADQDEIDFAEAGYRFVR